MSMVKRCQTVFAGLEVSGFQDLCLAQGLRVWDRGSQSVFRFARFCTPLGVAPDMLGGHMGVGGSNLGNSGS